MTTSTIDYKAINEQLISVPETNDIHSLVESIRDAISQKTRYVDSNGVPRWHTHLNEEEKPQAKDLAEVVVDQLRYHILKRQMRYTDQQAALLVRDVNGFDPASIMMAYFMPGMTVGSLKSQFDTLARNFTDQAVGAMVGQLDEMYDQRLTMTLLDERIGDDLEHLKLGIKALNFEYKILADQAIELRTKDKGVKELKELYLGMVGGARRKKEQGVA